MGRIIQVPAIHQVPGLAIILPELATEDMLWEVLVIGCVLLGIPHYGHVQQTAIRDIAKIVRAQEVETGAVHATMILLAHNPLAFQHLYLLLTLVVEPVRMMARVITLVAERVVGALMADQRVGLAQIARYQQLLLQVTLPRMVIRIHLTMLLVR